MKHPVISLLLFCLAVILVSHPVLAGRQQQDGFTLMVGYCYQPEQSRAVLDRMGATHHDRESWEQRRSMIRRGIMQGAKLDPLPEQRKPLQVIRHNKKMLDGYTVENVAIQTISGFWLCGNLYLPEAYDPSDKDASKIPGILSPHGHKKDKRFDVQVQARCGAFARMGCAVFAYDMVGYAETNQIAHRATNVLRLQTWNSIRALDFVESLAGIDPERLAVTGCSGGGTQTFILSAIDDRIDLSMPVCQVSAHFYGGCACESGMPIHVRETHETNNVEFAACFAPKPLLLVSNGKDWTQHTPEAEYPYIKSIYGYYNAASNIENAHFADEGHDYGPSKRAAACRFLAKHFKLDLKPLLNDNGEIHEAWYKELDAEALQVFTAEQPRPEGAINDAAELNKRLDELIGEVTARPTRPDAE